MMRISGERLFNLALGISFFFWAIDGLYESEKITFVRIGVSCLNGCVGFLLLFRADAIRFGNYKSILLALPSLILGGLIFSLSKDFVEWPIFTEIAFGVGLIITILSFISLGKSFSILPQVRKIVNGGMYRLIRHPAYLGECTLLISCVIESTNPFYSIVAFVGYTPLIIIRIRVEEKLLLSQVDYILYADQTKWRLIPGIW